MQPSAYSEIITKHAHIQLMTGRLNIVFDLLIIHALFLAERDNVIQ